MDTSLLNIMYDDVFDGNYSVYNTYDSTSEFWTTNEETMQMQLTEALQGILPIPPTEDFHLEDNSSVNIQDAKNSFTFDDVTEQHLGDDGGAIKTASVDSHAYGYDTDGDNEANCDITDVVGDHETYGNVFEQNDQQSLYSEITYGSHTYSSSIGDYESHSSDYDDDDEHDDEHDDDEENDEDDEEDNYTNYATDWNQNMHEIDHVVGGDPLPINEGEPFVLKNQSNTNYGSESPKLDVDGLDLNIDVQNFDLAEFITKEDDNFSLNYNLPPTTASDNLKIQDSLENVVRVIAPKPGDSDSDSDIIIDVESLEPDEGDDCNFKSPIQTVLPQTEYVDIIPDDDAPYVDNIKDDPSWTPTPISSVKKHNTAQHNKEVAAKKQMKSSNGGQKTNSLSKKLPSNCSKGKTKPSADRTKSNTTLDNKTAKDKRPLQEKEGTFEQKETLKRITPQNIAEGVSNKKQVTAVEVKKELQPPPIQTTTTKTVTEIIQPQKRKLNLEEYKKRLNERLNQKTSNNSTNNLKDVKINETSQTNNNPNSKTINSTKTNYPKSPQAQATSTKHSEMVTSIVKCLKEKTNDNKAVVDPITEARNKVLRMQELKKAQQLRIIDSTISAKIPKVTKVLPLREIVKDTPYLGNDEENKHINTTQIKSRPDYEEIIIVSASCNTDISIPPYKIQAENSLLKPYKLLSTISNTLQIVNTNENMKLSSNSLLSSIHGVVIKKSLPPLPSNETGTTTSPLSLRTEHSEEHGEDKIIMHLRKDRIRKCTSTVGVQTDLQAAFPPLTLIKVHLERKPRERERERERATTRKRNYRKRSESSTSSSTSHSSQNGECDRLAKSVETAAGLPHHSPEGSYSSVDYRRIYDGAIPNGGYSSRSTRRHRSSVSSSYSECVVNVTENRRQRRTSYKQRSKKRSKSPYTSSSSSSAGECNRSCSRDYKRSRSRSRIRSRVRSRSRSNSHSSIRNRKRRINQRKTSDHKRSSKVPTPAVEERRIVYVGRIEPETSKEKLLAKFSSYGSIKNISIHYKENGMKYGFVTFERSSDAFAAIDNGVHDPKINMYDVSFGGRREFCRATYADLDNAGINTYESYVYPKSNNQPSEKKDSFESLLQKMKDKLNANKKSSSTTNKI